MDAQLAAVDRTWSLADSPLAARIARFAASCLFVLVALAALLVCLRRIGGALTQPLSAAALVLAALLLAAAAILFRRWIAATVVNTPPRLQYAAWAAPSAVLALWTLALLVPGTAALGLVGFVGLLVAEEAWSWHSIARRPAERVMTPIERTREIGAPTGAAAVLAPTIVDEPEELVDTGVSQRLVRRREPDGGEVMEGWIRVEFLPAQRQATAHVAICPPFERTPECFAEPCDGPPSQVKVAQVLPYGVRFEVKLDEPAEEACDVMIELSIQEQPQGE